MNDEPLLAQYLPGDTLLHRLDPRSKTIAAFLLAIDALHAQWPWEVFGLGILAAAGMRTARVTLRDAWVPLRPLFLLIAFSAAVNLLTVPGPSLLHLGPLTISKPGVLVALDTITRLPVMILTASLLVWTTSPGALVDGLTAFGRPLRKLGPIGGLVQDTAFFVGLALRFLPMVHQSFRRVRVAFLARGIDADTGPIRMRWRFLAEMIIPWMIDILRRADEIALALVTRGYRRKIDRTPLQTKPWTKGDVLIVAASVLLTLWTWRRVLPRIPF
ncbi:MAG: energy-coupling factor transporter transmembrane protein EcfT [Alicyclobacillaceae bacterium]|nr:energy-coupling factor transporter transmembrane protein EcfT [Alicyclobacillaceae bacterium]